MADNYLERKMEEHRRGVAAKPVARRLTPASDRRGSVTLKIDELRVLVTDGSTETGEAIVRRLRDAGCRVAFTGGDEKSGNALAQACGARYYPCSFKQSVSEDLTRAWGGTDVTVVTDGQLKLVDASQSVIYVGELPDGGPSADIRVNAVMPDGLTSAEIAHLCLLLCLKGSECLNGVRLGRFNGR